MMSQKHSFILRQNFLKVTTKQINFYRIYQVFLRRYVPIERQNLLSNVLYRIVHMTETIALSKSWKKKLTAFRVSVSKLHVSSFCVASDKLRARVTVCLGS